MWDVRRYKPLVKRVSELEESVKVLSDDDFPKETERLRAEIRSGANIKKILPYCFALVREASVRTLGLRHFDVQVMGGAVLFEGKIAEMATGEGKTLVATLPVYVKAVQGLKTHIVTVNDYLARRDAYWMGPVYRFLGLSVGFIQHDSSVEDRQKAYSCDVNFITNNELGFDYLRDNMVVSSKDKVMKKREFAIIDEVDSILIDEARTPLIISGAGEEATEKYSIADRVASRLKVRFMTESEEVEAKYQEIDLKKGYDAIVDEKSHSVELTDTGIKKCEAFLGVKNMYDDIQSSWPHHITQSIRARHLFKKDSHYVVQEGEVVIVDEFTGRMMPGRRWSDGLHQAVEAKENISVKQESQTLATITFQNFFNIYDDKAGMTGTAVTEAPEFKKIYKLDVVCIPTNQKVARKKNDDQIYKTEKEKFNALINEVRRINAAGAPVLIGTRSIETNERIGSMLKRAGIAHYLLNAKFHEKEADIISQAGRAKAVTVATNMAGRGTDIILGGNPEFIAKQKMAGMKFDPLVEAEASSLEPTDNEEIKRAREIYKKLFAEAKGITDKEHEKVIESGGLHVIGSERHESRRVDNQLIGRCARQGDPGSAQFFISLEDELMRLFGGDRIKPLMERMGLEDGEVIEHPFINAAVSNAQKKIEAMHFDMRKQLLDFDNVLSKQRDIVYSLRNAILAGDGIPEETLSWFEDVIDSQMGEYLSDAKSFKWNTSGYVEWLKRSVGKEIDLNHEDMIKMSPDEIGRKSADLITQAWEERLERLGEKEFGEMIRFISIRVIDHHWKEHLLNLDKMREGIGLRGYAQKDPVVEYKKESLTMFEGMLDSVKKETMEFIFHMQVSTNRAPRQRGISVSQSAASSGSPSKADTTAEKHKKKGKIMPNDPCPCGSGKKYKKCCGRIV
ncbi:MAG: preprotein translocase subunit SecA, partial [Elusimicrobiota bacterium]|nr:preprotein translocase subunit SecA [Elusimicrobiota bacterium]